MAQQISLLPITKVALDTETQKLLHLFLGNEQYKYEQGFYGLKALPGLFTRTMTNLFAQLIRRNEVRTQIDKILLHAENKPQIFERIRNFHEAIRISKLKAAPDRTFFVLIAVIFLGHIVNQNKIKPLLSRIETIQQMKRPESKRTS